MVRIRYKKENDKLTSHPQLGTDGYLIAIVNKNGSFKITLSDQREIYRNDDFNTLHKAKKLVKRALQALGCKFEDEVRSLKKLEDNKREVLKLYQESITEDEQ